MFEGLPLGAVPALPAPHFINLADALNVLRPGVLGSDRFEELRQHRTTDAILKAKDELVDRVWHNHHLVRVEEYLSGRTGC